jgi:hypothetical protein
MFKNYQAISTKKFCTGNVRPKFEGGERNFFPVEKKVDPPPFLSQRTKACLLLAFLIIFPATFVLTTYSEKPKKKKKNPPTI